MSRRTPIQRRAAPTTLRTAAGRRVAMAALTSAVIAVAGDSTAQQIAGMPAAPIRSAQPSHEADVPVAPAETLRVTVTGRGDPVVLVPGLFGGAYGFRKLIAPLARSGHRSIVVEPLGVGGSARPADADYSLEAQTLRIAAALDSIGTDSALVVAHSIGASLAFRLALARPDLVRGIVSLEGGVAERAASDEMRSTLRLASIVTKIGFGGVVEGKLRDRLEAVSGDPSWLSDSVIDAYLAPYDDHGAAIDAYRRIAQAPRTRPLGPRLGDIRVPVELLRGDAPHEGGIPDEQLTAMRSLLPDLCVVRVARAGVMIHEERPDAVVAAVARLAHRARTAEAEPDPCGDRLAR